MIVHNVTQRSEEWESLRRGIPTASEFHRIVTPAQLKFAAGAVTYACEIVAQRLGIDSPPSMPSYWMEYGNEMEPHAFEEFAERHSVSPVGFVSTDDRHAGCSPDGLVGSDGVLEIKCPKAETLIQWHADGVIPSEHRIQVQGELWVCKREYGHFYAWHPEIEPLYLVTQRDDNVQAALDEAIPRFLELCRTIQAKVARRNSRIMQTSYRPEEVSL